MNLAYRRALYRDLQAAQNSVLKTSDIIQLQRDVSERIERDTDKYIVGNEIPSLGEQIDKIWAEIEEKQVAGGGYKINCIPQLNEYFSIERQELVVFMGNLSLCIK